MTATRPRRPRTHAIYLYEKQWRLNRAAGRPTGPVDATAAAANARHLHELGCSITAIAHAAGMSVTGLAHVLDGDYPRMQHRNAATLEAVTLRDVIDRALPQHYLPRWAARRRVHALMALGHSHTAITVHLREGLRSTNVVGTTAHGPYLRAHTWRDVDRVYRLLAITPGTSERTRRRALTAGHQPPLAWEDIDQPDLRLALATTMPDDSIDTLAVQRALDGHPVDLTRAERREVTRILTSRGVSAQEIAARLDVADRTIVRWRREFREQVAA